MTDEPQGHGWWQASDLKWYPPERHPDYTAALPQPRPAERPPTEIGTPPPPLWEKRANHTSSPRRAVGGHLRVAGDTLTFSPHIFDRASGAKNVAIRLADIKAFEVEPVNLGHFYGGGLRKRLAVVTRDGQRELFVVNNLGKTIEELRALARQHGES